MKIGLTSGNVYLLDVVVVDPACGSILGHNIVLREVVFLGGVDKEHGSVVIGYLKLVEIVTFPYDRGRSEMSDSGLRDSSF